MNNTVTIVVPVYRVENYLGRCVDSILEQTYKAFHLVLVDDGSPDNCGAICDDYAKKDSRVAVIHQENGGLSAARNTGIDWAFANSDSEWITFIDSDDWVHPCYLEILLSAANQMGASMAICEHIRTDRFSEYGQIQKKPKLIDVEDFYCSNHVTATVAWGKLYKLSDFESVRYPLGKIHEDEYTTYKILLTASRVAYIDEPLYFYYINNQGIMSETWKLNRLDAIEGLRQQVFFCKQNKFLVAYRFAVNNYVDYLVYDLKQIQALYPDKKRTVVGLRTELRKLIIFTSYKMQISAELMNIAYGLAFPITFLVLKKLRKKKQALQYIIRRLVDNGNR